MKSSLLKGLLPVSCGSDAEQVSWTVAVAASTASRVVLVAARSLPEFCGTEETARVTLLLRCADDRHLTCGEAELSWRQLLEGRLAEVPDTRAEFEALASEFQDRDRQSPTALGPNPAFCLFKMHEYTEYVVYCRALKPCSTL